MREVRRPRHVLDAHLMADAHPAAIDDEGREPVIAEVVAGHLLQLGAGPQAIPPPAIVGHLEEVRDPADAGLDRRHTERRGGGAEPPGRTHPEPVPAGGAIGTAGCVDGAVVVCWAASSRWMLTGMSRCAAASQNGSSSARRLSPPDGHAEMATPWKPSFFARSSSLTDVSMPTLGIWKVPIRRPGSGPQKTSFRQGSGRRTPDTG